MVTRFLPAYSASEKLVCFFIVVGPLRELPSATSSATSAMTAEPDKSAFP
ncbi:type II secretion system F family protein, partial [Ralstonia solanacearum]